MFRPVALCLAAAAACCTATITSTSIPTSAVKVRVRVSTSNAQEPSDATDESAHSEVLSASSSDNSVEAEQQQEGQASDDEPEQTETDEEIERDLDRMRNSAFLSVTDRELQERMDDAAWLGGVIEELENLVNSRSEGGAASAQDPRDYGAIGVGPGLLAHEGTSGTAGTMPTSRGTDADLRAITRRLAAFWVS